MNCTGKRCIMQHDKVDPATCTAVSYCPQATPPKTNADRIRVMTGEELVEFLYWDADGSGKTREQWLDWLKGEANNEREEA